MAKLKQAGDITRFKLTYTGWVEDAGAAFRYSKDGFYYDLNIGVFFCQENDSITHYISDMEELTSRLKKELYKIKRRKDYADKNKKL